MVKHNNVVPNGHFSKQWMGRVKTWLDQPKRKETRRRLRAAKAAAIFPRPVKGAVRPLVQCPTVKYNLKERMGRGFTVEELKGAAIPLRYAQTIGIAIDRRRRNRSAERLTKNIQRLKEYMSRLVVYPLHGMKAGDVEQMKGVVMPIEKTVPEVEFSAITDADKKFRAYDTLRMARVDAHLVGFRVKKAQKAQN
uniref:60S ribosomal protein L13-1 n=1 Tax=Stygiella incarcerata TaxID=1712417 RepID=A0A192ZI29_9EUKA|nr:60S ribosomal protein L13-1 [Stygiella incarcerata]|eukprot:TRINITY_DN1407_c0_g1_i1.p1 TRINITY_DN1407_c0_g1~~TRINITY_DN1407_c0_g1_i1.p1  ORF type:complete len:194 (-),score=45.53 TRINITY_DN1407_c0_g1_i1:84-665(-)